MNQPDDSGGQTAPEFRGEGSDCPNCGMAVALPKGEAGKNLACPFCRVPLKTAATMPWLLGVVFVVVWLYAQYRLKLPSGIGWIGAVLGYFVTEFGGSWVMRSLRSWFPPTLVRDSRRAALEPSQRADTKVGMTEPQYPKEAAKRREEIKGK